MPITGDFDKLSKLIETVGQNQELKKELYDQAANQIYLQIQKSFSESKAPDGTPWKPLAWRAGRPLVTGNPGGLQNSFDVKADAEGVKVTNDKPYAEVHQKGGRTRKPHGKTKSKAKVGEIPARPFLPTFLPKSWNDAIAEAFSATLRKFFQ